MSVTRFRAKQAVQSEIKDTKADKRPQRIVQAGNGDTATVNVPGRDNFYYVRIEDEDGHVVWFSEAFSGIPLSYDDRVVIQKAEDEKLTYYEVVAWLEDSGGGIIPPLPVHDHHDNTEGGQNLRQLLQLGLDEATQLTIGAGGDITVTQAYHSIETNGGAVTDDLDTINGRTEPDFLVIRPHDDAHTVVVRTGVGNIVLQGGQNITLDDIEDHLLLIYDPTNAVWVDFGGGAVNWGQTVVVAVSGGDYTSVATACTAVAAVPPAAATPWTILVMSGVFNEAAGFIVPIYTTLIGRGESTVIDCADTVWTCGAYASAMDIVVKSTCNTWGACYLQQNTVGVVLRNVKVVIDQDTALTNRCFCWAGTGNAEAFHCTAEAVDTGTETVGFWIGGTVNEVLLWDCIADDTTNIDNGLELDNSACFATTKRCEFGGADDDVAIGANATWNHYACQYDEGNSTINGTDNLLPGDGGGAGVLEVQVFS